MSVFVSENLIYTAHLEHIYKQNLQISKFLICIAAGVLINIECKAWAKNIFYDRYERRGSVHFELMVDKA